MVSSNLNGRGQAKGKGKGLIPEWLRRLILQHKLLVILLTAALLLIAASAIIHRISGQRIWGNEVSKSLLGLSFTIIIGGLVTILIRNVEADKLKTTRVKEFRDGILNRLAKVFDDVDVARILITSHRSVKTYGEAIRGRIIPSSVTLYDIKRSLTSAQVDFIKLEDRNHLRVHIHYMLAYLAVLIAGFRDDYIELSNQQYLHEGYKQRIREGAVELFVEQNQELIDPERDALTSTEIINSDNNGTSALNQLSENLWNSLEALPHLRDFLIDNHESSYYHIFIYHYEECKRILKEQKESNRHTEPDEFKRYLDQLDEIDKKSQEGTLLESDSLVKLIMEEKLNHKGGPVFA